MKETLLADLIQMLTELDTAKNLLDEVLSHYDLQRHQFNAIDTMKFAPRGDLRVPKNEWKSESDKLNNKIHEYLKQTC